MQPGPITLGADDLLEYNVQHSVLICQECKYAIQKSAVESHLLRHKIYRAERQRLLSSIARLQLLEPDEVRLPAANSPPVNGLPIISGFRCTFAGCEALFASSKRMKRHWSESHGLSHPPASFTRPVSLQTFFRGTKLRYFEVESHSTAAVGGPLVAGAVSESAQQQHGHSSVTSRVARVEQSTPAVRSRPPLKLDLETMVYFHHFMVTTSLTLPAEGHEPVKRWQTDVVANALRAQWMMCGLLAISMSHMASLSDDEVAKQVHQEQSTRFHEQFLAGWEERQRSADTRGIEAETSTQISAIQRCWLWISTTTSDTSHEEDLEHVPFQLLSFMTTVQGCFEPASALHSALSVEAPPENTSVQTDTSMGETSAPGTSNNMPPALRDHFHNLPYRMAEVLEKPDTMEDFFAPLSALEALVDCCSLSYASGDRDAAWVGMASWLRRLSGHFTRMVSGRNSGALIVLAQWSLLVRRAEPHCWFLEGSAAKMLRQIMRELPDNNAIQSMVKELMD